VEKFAPKSTVSYSKGVVVLVFVVVAPAPVAVAVVLVLVVVASSALRSPPAAVSSSLSANKSAKASVTGVLSSARLHAHGMLQLVTRSQVLGTCASWFNLNLIVTLSGVIPFAIACGIRSMLLRFHPTERNWKAGKKNCTTSEITAGALSHHEKSLGVWCCRTLSASVSAG
jgi:hypothetical protein